MYLEKWITIKCLPLIYETFRKSRQVYNNKWHRRHSSHPLDKDCAAGHIQSWLYAIFKQQTTVANVIISTWNNHTQISNLNTKCLWYDVIHRNSLYIFPLFHRQLFLRNIVSMFLIALPNPKTMHRCFSFASSVRIAIGCTKSMHLSWLMSMMIVFVVVVDV